MTKTQEIVDVGIKRKKNRAFLLHILNDGNASVKWMQRVKGNGKLAGIGTMDIHSTRNNYSNGMLAKMKARNIHCIAREGPTSNVSAGLMGDAEKQEEGIR